VLETLSIKISSADKARLKAMSKARNVPLSALVREGLEKVLAEASTPESPSCYDLVARYFEEPGRLSEGGPSDLSTNTEHLGDYGKS
jgi:hypothetical protein